jgi:hypothetical protein
MDGVREASRDRAPATRVCLGGAARTQGSVNALPDEEYRRLRAKSRPVFDRPGVIRRFTPHPSRRSGPPYGLPFGRSTTLRRSQGRSYRRSLIRAQFATWMSQRVESASSRETREASQSHAFDWPAPGEGRSPNSLVNEEHSTDEEYRGNPPILASSLCAQRGIRRGCRRRGRDRVRRGRVDVRWHLGASLVHLAASMR